MRMSFQMSFVSITHWGRLMHIYISKLTIIGLDNGLPPGWRQAITWTNAGILLIGPLGTNFSEILIKIHTFSFKKMPLKKLCAKWWRFSQPQCVKAWFMFFPYPIQCSSQHCVIWDPVISIFNSLAPGKFEWNFRYVIFKWILVTDGWGISCEIALIWMSLDFTDDQSTLVQVMAWCRQATSHYLSQCWPRSVAT